MKVANASWRRLVRATCSRKEVIMISEASDGREEKYQRFLYAPIMEQNNGTPVSVVSALARGGHDPWEEAARLARLPADRAQIALKELLGEGLSRSLSFIEREDAAKRLVLLLPAETSLMPMMAASPLGKEVARQLAYWLVWVGYIVMLILAQEHNRASSLDVGYPTENQLVEGSGKSDQSAQSNREERTINGVSSNHD